jgi:hypothetical protein
MFEPTRWTAVVGVADAVGAGVVGTLDGAVWPPLVWCFLWCFLWCLTAVLAGGGAVELLGGGVEVVGGGVEVVGGGAVEVGGGGGGGGVAPNATAALTPAHSATVHTATQLAIPLVLMFPLRSVCPDEARLWIP